MQQVHVAGELIEDRVSDEGKRIYMYAIIPRMHELIVISQSGRWIILIRCKREYGGCEGTGVKWGNGERTKDREETERGAEPWKGGKKGKREGGEGGKRKQSALPLSLPPPVGCLNRGLFTAVGGKTNSALIPTLHMSTHFRYTLDAPAFSPPRRRFKAASPPQPPNPTLPPPPPSSLSDYSFFKEQTFPWWAEFINKFGFDCMHQSPHHELICIHTSTLVEVPTKR